MALINGSITELGDITIAGDVTATDVTATDDVTAGDDVVVGDIISSPTPATMGAIEFENAAQTVDGPFVMTGTTANHIVVCEYGDRAVDWGFTQQTDPTVYICSGDGTDTTTYGSLAHDRTDFVITPGKGAVKVAGNLAVTGTSTMTGSIISNYIAMTYGYELYGGTLGVYGGIMPMCVTQTPYTMGFFTGSASNHILIAEHADRATDFGHAQQINPTVYIQSADATDTTQWVSLAHNQTDAVDGIGSGSKITQHNAPVELADDGSFDLPDASAGFGTIMCGDGEEWAQITWTSAGVVTLIANSANAVATDTDTKFCIFDNGTAVRVRNRLGSAKKVVFNYDYTTP